MESAKPACEEVQCSWMHDRLRYGLAYHGRLTRKRMRMASSHTRRTNVVEEPCSHDTGRFKEAQMLLDDDNASRA